MSSEVMSTKGICKDGICHSIRPGRRNPTVHGCIRPDGHEGLHVNGQNVSWFPKKKESTHE
jgi:hypothetical protein